MDASDRLDSDGGWYYCKVALPQEGYPTLINCVTVNWGYTVSDLAFKLNVMQLYLYS